MKILICLGPVIGTISQADIDASIEAVERGDILHPIPQAALGHNKRGVERPKTVKAGIVRLDDSGRAKSEPARGDVVIEPCGYNMRTLVDAVPEDGHEYDVECPRCSNVMKVKRLPADHEAG